MKKLCIGLIAIVVIVSVSSAFATKSSNNSKATIYDVLTANNDGTYTVQVDNGTGHCDEDEGSVCTVSSDAPPSDSKIPQTSATILEGGAFSD